MEKCVHISTWDRKSRSVVPPLLWPSSAARSRRPETVPARPGLEEWATARTRSISMGAPMASVES